MHDGSHDMKAFGLGFLRSLASVPEQRKMQVFLWHTYVSLEESLDMAKGPAADVWRMFDMDLRRRNALESDLDMLEVPQSNRAPSAATKAYTDRMREVAVSDPDLLIGHFYTRYFADLFGGSMQGYPTKMALGLPRDLAFYQFPEAVEVNRRGYIEKVYAAINDAAVDMSREKRAVIVNEARLAFRHNANAYTERPYLLPGAVVGGVRTAAGMAYGGLMRRKEMVEWLVKLGAMKKR